MYSRSFIFIAISGAFLVEQTKTRETDEMQVSFQEQKDSSSPVSWSFFTIT